MAIPKTIKDAAGSWKGKSKLHLSWLPEAERITECDSTLHVDLDRNQSFATVTYVWSHEGKEHEGSILLSGSEKEGMSAGFTDSWHMSTGVLPMKSDKFEANVKGHYSAGEELWGWRVAVEVSGDTLKLKMFNATPKGEEEWAVEGTYKRA